MYFRVNEFEVGVNDSIFSGNKQQKVYHSEDLDRFGRVPFMFKIWLGQEDGLR